MKHREFYFIRHGQTDDNLLPAHLKRDRSVNISLNDTGRAQARFVEPIISSLPIKTVCSSPLKRVQETKELVTSNLVADHFTVPDLGECTNEIWIEMTAHGMYTDGPQDGASKQFLERVQKGLDHTLS